MEKKKDNTKIVLNVRVENKTSGKKYKGNGKNFNGQKW